MFLRNLRLTNVRSIKDLSLTFQCDKDGGEPVRKWTYLLGENGTGKSTVLRCIALVLAGSEALPELVVRADDWVREGERECAVGADLVTADGRERAISFALRRGDGLTQILDRNRDAMDAIDQAVSHADRNYFTVGYGVSRRLSRGGSFSSPEQFQKPRARTVATLFSPDAALRPLHDWAMDLHYRRGNRGLHIIRAALEGMLPGVRFRRIDKKHNALMFDTPDGEVPLSRLSDGYQNVAAWCGDLLYRITDTFKERKDPLSSRGLLLIDEIDLHLHPLWQRQLRSFINGKLPHFQIVATTHSPLTVQQAGPEEVFALRRAAPDKPPVLHQFPGEPRKLMLHQLVLTPFFGLETLDSQQVQAEREEYRRLRKMKAKGPGARRRLKQLGEDLRDLPDWRGRSTEERKQEATLDRIQSLLAGDPPADGKGGRVAPNGKPPSKTARRSRRAN